MACGRRLCDASARIVCAEKFFSNLDLDILDNCDLACYHWDADLIEIPSFEAFRDPVAYYATLAHEVVHWTGAPHRLARERDSFGTPIYAFEELIAELGAAILCADLDLANQPMPDHTSYIAHWLKTLGNDTAAIFRAATKAQQAVTYLHDLQAAVPRPTIIGAPVSSGPS